ncbi:MAG TPA: response regulator transcription factor [Candidatus Limnocylindrales bacterium]|nr:response regulator transcription factor [Candidatus Limnocylindrales bacterium]
MAELQNAARELRGPKRFDMVIVGTSAESPISPDQVRQLRWAAESPLTVLAEGFDETQDTLDVYKAGADQVLPKPFGPDALLGAIQAAMRQPGPVSVVPMARRIELGQLAFDGERRRVQGKDADVSFTKREWQVLSFLLASPNQFFTGAEVAHQAWGPAASTEQLRGYVARIRKKLTPFARYCRLTTERAKGYCLVIEEGA